MTAASLTPEAIVDASIALIENGGLSGLTVRRLGLTLGVDPTAFYRHFKDKAELLRAVADRIHRDVLIDLPSPHGAWQLVVRELCIRLRAAHVTRPDLAALISAGPPLQANEFLVTESLLTQLQRSGLADPQVALAYHALIELTIGSAAIDAPVAALSPDDRLAAYSAWRRVYAALDQRTFPASTTLSAHLYTDTAEQRFVFALELMIAGLSTSDRRCM